MEGFPFKNMEYGVSHWTNYFSKFISNGVYANPATSMQVQADSGLTVKIAVGSCYINGRVANADGTDKLTVSYGGDTERTDTVIVRLDLAKGKIYPLVVEDAVSENAIVRDGTYYDLALAEIVVPENATEITQAEIRDVRSYDNVCGWVKCLIDQIDTTNLFAQYEAAWDEFVKSLGESDHITIDTADRRARVDIKSIRSQIPFENNFKLI